MPDLTWVRAPELDDDVKKAAYLKKHDALTNYKMSPGFTVWSTPDRKPVLMVTYNGPDGTIAHTYRPG